MSENLPYMIFFCRPESYDYAANEIANLQLGRCAPLGAGVGAVYSDTEEYLAAVRRLRDALFVRQTEPVSISVSPEGLSEAVIKLSGGERKLTLHTTSSDTELTAEKLRYMLIDGGDFADYEFGTDNDRIISLYAYNGIIYAGSSRRGENLNPRAGGIFRYAFDEGNISRAEFKLTEALELYPIETGKRALDLGAAPGGWTRVLRAKGAEVTAVDPAELDPRLLSDRGITHYKGLSQSFVHEYRGERFDIVVNDMRMDALKSVSVTLETLGMLKPRGFIVITLKLPEKKSMKAAKSALALLSRSVDVIGARQLYHNRSEITAVCRKHGE